LAKSEQPFIIINRSTTTTTTTVKPGVENMTLKNRADESGSDRNACMQSLLSSARMNSLLDIDGSQVGNTSRARNGILPYCGHKAATTISTSTSNEMGEPSTTSAGHIFHQSRLGNSEQNESSSPSSVGASVPDLPEGGSFGSKARAMPRGYNSMTNANTSNDISSKVATDKEDCKRDEYVRSGTHFRSLLDNALQKVAKGFSNVDEEQKDGTENPSASSDEFENYDYDDGEERNRRKRGSARGDRDESRPQRNRRYKRSKMSDKDDGCTQDAKRRNDNPCNLDKKHASDLAMEKVAEVMRLKRELKEAEEHSNAMIHANAALRDASAASSARMVNLTEALRIAGEKAANARADADAAEARSSSLATQLKSFKSVLNETKVTVESIRTEHNEISAASKDLEQKLLRTESELSWAQKQKKQLEKLNKVISTEVKDLKQSEEILKSTVEKRSDELLKLKKTLMEREDIENARAERTERLENELKKARSVLVEMSSGAAEGEATIASLRQTIDSLQKENESLHKKIDESLDSFSKERTKLQQALAEVENEAQRLRLKAATDDEEFQKLKLDKASSEKEVRQLKNRLVTLERRFAEVGAVDCISPGHTISDVSSIGMDFTISACSSDKTPGQKKTEDSLTTTSRDLFNIPKLKSMSPKPYGATVGGNVDSAKRDDISTGSKTVKRPLQTKCSICHKASYGIMKSCQCGNPTCYKRAHASCISGKCPLPSVSHPGTPAPSLPVVLCSTARA